MGLEGAKSGAFILRFLEVITAIVAFSTVVDYDSSSRIKFVMFTGISGFIIAFFFMLAYLASVRAARGLFSFALDLLWTLFWLVAAACASAVLADNSWSGSKMQASVAFSWISFFLWIGSTIISFQDWRGGVSGPAPAAGPQIPNSSMAMV